MFLKENLQCFLVFLVFSLVASTEIRQREATEAEKAAFTAQIPRSNDIMEVGTSFVFAYVNSHLSADDTSYTENLWLTISNTATNMATVQVTSPSPLFTNTTFTVPASTSKAFPITPVSMQTDYMDLYLQSAFIGNKTLWVTSDQPIRLVATNQLSDGSSEDKFAIMPICELGTTYFAVNDESARKIGPSATNVITIIATQDNTVVNCPIVNGNATLMKGQQLTIATYLPTSAVPVTASAPVAVISGSVCGFGYNTQSHCSHQVLMLYPVTGWSQQIPYFKYLPEDKGEVMLFFKEDQTTVFLNNQPFGVYNASGFVIFEVSSGVEILGTKPIYAAAVGSSNTMDQGAPFFVHVAPSALFTNGPVQFATGLNTDEAQNMVHYVRIVTILNDIGTIGVDGYYPSGLIYRRMGGSYYFVDVSIQPGQHVVVAANTNAVFGVTVYGFGEFKSYAFNAGLNLPANGVC